MNVLFVNYGDFTTNSLNHIGGFAGELQAHGHDCTVVVPGGKETLGVLHKPAFRALTSDEALASPACFADGRGADLIHAWTPRECVRRFVVAYQAAAPTPARLVVHLEDDEEHLLEVYTGLPWEKLAALDREERERRLVDRLSHPLRLRNLLWLADGVTIITEKLREHVPPGPPVHLLHPGVDPRLYHPMAPDAALRGRLGLADGEKLIVLTGSTTFANEAEIEDLYHAVGLLNRRKIPTRLVRTGLFSDRSQADMPADILAHVIDLGFVDKERLPPLLALADVLVQPGRPGRFNDHRLPSKLPEFFASGRPVVLPAANVGAIVRDGIEGLLLRTGDPAEIADACERVLRDPSLGKTLATHGAAFARRHFDLAANTTGLLGFYSAILDRPARTDWRTARPRFGDLAVVLGRILASHPEVPADVAGNLIRQVDDLQEEHTTTGRNAAAALGEATRALELTRQHAANLEGMLAAGRTELDQWRQQFSELEKTLALREHELGLTHRHATNLEGMLAAGRAELEQQRQQFSELEKAVALHEHQLELTRRHAANLEENLAAERTASALTRQHAANLEETLTATRQQAEAVQRDLESTTDLLLRARTRIAALDRWIRHSHDELVTHEARRAAEVSALQAELAERERKIAGLEYKAARLEGYLLQRIDKILRMQQSVSWRLTAPLRALRRTFIDRWRPKPAPLPTPRPPNIVHAIDNPTRWDAAPAAGMLRGWCFCEGATRVRAVRARIGSHVLPARVGLLREDVARAHHLGGPDRNSHGFEIDYRLEVDATFEVAIEAQAADGTWIPFYSNTLHTSRRPRAVHDYSAWVEAFGRLDPGQVRGLRARLAALPPEARPLISVLMPVFDPAEPWLERALESVHQQIYENWELCLADDASTQPHVRRVLEAHARRDPRVRVVWRAQNGHISRASNSALEMARGAFVALLDHDDELAPEALAEVVLALAANPLADVVYSDEDKVDETGRRHNPYFKPDFLPDLLTGQNCISHLGVFRTSLVREVGGFRPDYEGSQDWDLALRVAEKSAPERIVHVPKVLYHWRTIGGSTALAVQEKEYSLDAARRALADHFARTGVPVQIAPVPGSHWRIIRPLPDPAPRVTIVIPTRNAASLLRTCTDSILALTDYHPFDLLVLNNNSDEADATALLDELARTANVRVIDHPGRFNFSAIVNHGAREAGGEILCLLNNDIEIVHDDWLREMVSHAVRPEIGVVGAMLYYPDNTIQHAGTVLGLGGVANHAFVGQARGTDGHMNRARLVQNYSAVTGACMVVRRAVFERAGGFNETNLPVAFNDVDFCLRVRAAGFRNLWTPFAELVHHESVSRGLEDSPEKKKRFAREVAYMRRTWGPQLDADPAYNPNLALSMEGWDLAWPPRTPRPGEPAAR